MIARRSDGVKSSATSASTGKLSLRKKLCFSALVLLIVTPSCLILAEIGYRWKHSIPLTGGRLYEEDLRMMEADLQAEPWKADLLNMFRKSDNPILFYEPRPGYNDGFYSINAHGFRDREFVLEKAPGTIRIAVLGDSIIWGHGLPLELTFAKQLERLLNTRFDRTFEVLNFGVSGYSTQQEVELYRIKASLFDPDLVIVGYCLNDYRESSEEADVFRQLHYDIFSKSYLFDRVVAAAKGLVYNTIGVQVVDENLQGDLRRQFELLQSYHRSKRRMVVIFPVLIDFKKYPSAFEHRRAADALAGLEFELLDLLEHYREHAVESLVQNDRDKTHPNGFGMRIAAQATLNLLVEKNLIPAE